MNDESAEMRLRRVGMRSWRRGMKEMDLILGRFADARLAELGAEELDAYEALLDENDQDLYRWISGSAAPPAQHVEMVGIVTGFHGIQR